MNSKCSGAFILLWEMESVFLVAEGRLELPLITRIYWRKLLYVSTYVSSIPKFSNFLSAQKSQFQRRLSSINRRNCSHFWDRV